MVVAKLAIPDLHVALQLNSSAMHGIPVLDGEAVDDDETVVVGDFTYHTLCLAPVQYARMGLEVPLGEVVIVRLITFETTIEFAFGQCCESKFLFWLSCVGAFFDPDGAVIHCGFE